MLISPRRRVREHAPCGKPRGKPRAGGRGLSSGTEPHARCGSRDRTSTYRNPLPAKVSDRRASVPLSISGADEQRERAKAVSRSRFWCCVPRAEHHTSPHPSRYDAPRESEWRRSQSSRHSRARATQALTCRVWDFGPIARAKSPWPYYEVLWGNTRFNRGQSVRGAAGQVRHVPNIPTKKGKDNAPRRV